MSDQSDDNISFYPPFPVPGSNAFGKFAFGESPFGSIQPFNWRATVISAYANSPTILTLINDWYDSIDQTENIDNFFNNIWNVYTATGYGLDVWGLIVGVNRNLLVNNPASPFFGFQQGVIWDTLGPGGSSPFYTGEALTSNFALTDAAYLQLILAKALANICDGSIPSLNAILLRLFGPGNPFGPGGNCFVTNGQDMSMTFTFDFDLSPVQSSIIRNSNVLPVPGGVTATIITP